MKLALTTIGLVLAVAAGPVLAQSTMGSSTKEEKKSAREEQKAEKKDSTGSATAAQPTSTGSTQPTTGSTGTTQQSGSGLPSLVNVNLEKVRAEIANNANIDISKVPITAQVPVNAAANICGVSVNALGGTQGSGGTPTCTATNSSLALQHVQNQIK